MNITAIVNDRTITATVDGKPVYGRGMDRMTYELDEEWGGFEHVLAYFASGERNTPVELDGTSGEVTVPDVTAGKLRITFHAFNDSDGDYLKTARMKHAIMLERHGRTTPSVGDQQPVELYASLMEAADAAEAVAAEVQRKLDAGELKGEKGDRGEKGDPGERGERGDPGQDGTLVTLYSDGNGIYDREGGDLLTFAQIRAVMEENGNSVAVNIGDTWIGYYSYMALDAIAWSNCLLLDGSSYNLRLIINDQNEVKESEEIVVSDVQINGTSITSDGVANIPLATASSVGVLKPASDTSGLFITSSGNMRVAEATAWGIDNRAAGNYRPIVPANIDYAMKAAMTDGKGAAWTDAEKLAARERMGCSSVYDLPKIADITMESDAVLHVGLPTPVSVLRLFFYNGTDGAANVANTFMVGLVSYPNLVSTMYTNTERAGAVAIGDFVFDNRGKVPMMSGSQSSTFAETNGWGNQLQNRLYDIFTDVETISGKKVTSVRSNLALKAGTRVIIYGE